jgi:tellurite resistance protein TehA-like permease
MKTKERLSWYNRFETEMTRVLGLIGLALASYTLGFTQDLPYKSAFKIAAIIFSLSALIQIILIIKTIKEKEKGRKTKK